MNIEDPHLIDHIDTMHERLQKVRQIANSGSVHHVDGMQDVYAVQASNGTAWYLVNLYQSCSCPDFRVPGEALHGICKHRLACLLFEQHQAERREATGHRNGVAA